MGLRSCISPKLPCVTEVAWCRDHTGPSRATEDCGIGRCWGLPRNLS